LIDQDNYFFRSSQIFDELEQASVWLVSEGQKQQQQTDVVEVLVSTDYSNGNEEPSARKEL